MPALSGMRNAGWFLSSPAQDTACPCQKPSIWPAPGPRGTCSGAPVPLERPGRRARAPRRTLPRRDAAAGRLRLRDGGFGEYARDHEPAVERAEQPTPKPKRPKPPREPKQSAPSQRSAREARQLEQRIEQLEEELGALKREGATLATYGLNSGPLGYRPLREFLTRKLNKQCGIECTADEILITSGSTQGLALVNSLLVGKGDTILVEQETYGSAISRLIRIGVNAIGIPLDDEGMRLDVLRHKLEELKRKGVRP